MIRWLKAKLRINRQRRRDRSARLDIRWAQRRQERKGRGWLARFPTWRVG